jgi:hypothetical protein
VRTATPSRQLIGGAGGCNYKAEGVSKRLLGGQDRDGLMHLSAGRNCIADVQRCVVSRLDGCLNLFLKSKSTLQVLKPGISSTALRCSVTAGIFRREVSQDSMWAEGCAFVHWQWMQGVLQNEGTEEDSHVLLGHAQLCRNGDVLGVYMKMVAGAICCIFDGWFHGFARRLHAHWTHLCGLPRYVRSWGPKEEDPTLLKTPYAVQTPHARTT